MFKRIIFYIFRIIFLTIFQFKYNTYLKKKLNSPKQEQDQILKKILDSYNSSILSSKYGKCYTYEDYIKNVPPLDYKDIESYIDLDRRENNKISSLSSFKIKTYEKTSGSSSKIKYIPYTSELLKSFNNMFIYWLYDILKFNPDLRTGKSYFMISPLTSDEENTGLSDDSEYITGIIGFFIRPFFVAPNIKTIKSSHNYMLITSIYLISNDDLEILSFWSPTWILTLIKFIDDNFDEIATHISQGQVVLENKTYNFPKRIVKSNESNILFPSLKIVSCWGDGIASEDYARVEKYFKNILIQKKGILATECPMTFPIMNGKYHTPCLEDIFFEFISKDQSILRLHELKIDNNYELLISQLGGLYRYKMNDIIKVKCNLGQTPTLEFLSRSGNTSDLVGEKLSENIILDIKNELKTKGISLLAVIPHKEINNNYYNIIVDNFSSDISTLISEALSSITHYKIAKRQQQLRDIKIFSCSNWETIILEYYSQVKKMKLGDIKPPLLLSKEYDGNLMTSINNQLKHYEKEKQV